MAAEESGQPWKQGDSAESRVGVGVIERVTGRKARGLQTEEIGCMCQNFFLLKFCVAMTTPGST